jgi:hypothetical protein
MTGLFGESNLSNSILTGETMSDNIITTEERYTSATHASNLRCESDKPGQIDPIIAAGMSPSRMGAALLRLHSEYDGASKPPGQAAQTDVTMMMVSIKSLPGVREQLAIAADRMGISREVSGAVLLWWLDHKCPACGGTALELVNGGKTGRACKKCRGTGEIVIPHGEAGKRVATFIDDCLDRARHSIKKRLRG